MEDEYEKDDGNWKTAISSLKKFHEAIQDFSFIQRDHLLLSGHYMPCDMELILFE